MKYLTKNKPGRYVMARIMRQNEMHHKNFSVKEFGSWEKALAAGKAYIDELLKTLPPSLMNQKGRMSSSNTSGVVGVALTKKMVETSAGNVYTYYSWCAKWPECPRKGGIKFAIGNKHSDEDAFFLACMAREHESLDRPWLMNKLKRLKGGPTWKKFLDKKMTFVEDNV